MSNIHDRRNGRRVAPRPFRYRLGQKVRVRETLCNGEPSPEEWSGQILRVIDKTRTQLNRHYYTLRKPGGARHFWEEEIEASG